MIALLWFVLAILALPFKSKSRLEAENAALRRQLIVLRRNVHGRVRLTNNDRLFFVQLYRWFSSIRQVLTIVRPETLIRWHQAGFRCYWRWKSRSMGGRPRIESDLRALIRRMSVENPLWGAPRIHGELLKLGFEVAQSTVAKYMAKRPGPPSQGWRTFLRNHAPDIAAFGQGHQTYSFIAASSKEGPPKSRTVCRGQDPRPVWAQQTTDAVVWRSISYRLSRSQTKALTDRCRTMA